MDGFDFVRFFEGGGWPMYPILLLGAAGLVASLGLGAASLMVTRPNVALLSAFALVGLGMLTFALGVVGQHRGLSAMEAAIAHVNPEDQEVIRYAGNSEARGCVILALALGMWPLAAGVALLGLGLARAKPGGARGLLVASTPIVAAGVLIACVIATEAQLAQQRGEEAVAQVAPSDRETVATLMKADVDASRVRLLGAVPFLGLGAALFVAAVGRRKGVQAA